MFGFTIIKKRHLEGYKMYQDAWLRELSRANKLEEERMLNEKLIEAQKAEIEELKKELNLKLETIRIMDEDMAELEKKLHSAVEDDNEETIEAEVPFAERIKLFRKAHCIIQRELATELGVSTDTVRKWESGKIPSKENLDKLIALMEGK